MALYTTVGVSLIFSLHPRATSTGRADLVLEGEARSGGNSGAQPAARPHGRLGNGAFEGTAVRWQEPADAHQHVLLIILIASFAAFAGFATIELGLSHTAARPHFSFFILDLLPFRLPLRIVRLGLQAAAVKCTCVCETLKMHEPHVTCACAVIAGF